MSLIDYVSSDYQKASNFLKPKSDPKTVLVYVEDFFDISFWHNILSCYEKQLNIEFEIKCYSNNTLNTGKSNLSNLTNQTGKFLLICCDSDYDYLFPEYSDMAREINSNPYIFQTHAYSIENLKCYAESLYGVCVQATNVSNIKINFVETLEKYSQIIYDLFIWNLYFYNQGKTQTFTISNFCSLIKITEIPEMNENGDFLLEQLENRVNEKLQDLQQNFPNIKDDIPKFISKINHVGLKDTNTYLFIKGHIVYDNVVLRLLPLVCKRLQTERKNEIKKLARNNTELNDELNKYNNSLVQVEKILSVNNNFKNCFLFKKIEDDINNYISLYMDN